VGNITFDKLDFVGSLNGGIRVSDMHGDVTLRHLRMIRKPGTRNLLSTPSDALHLMNIRGKLLIENCGIESPGDDCLNVGTLMERIVEISKVRNAMLVCAQNMTIEANRLDGSRGGVMGLNFTHSMGESARLRTINISNNSIVGFQSSGIIMANAYRDRHGVLDTRDFTIRGNLFQLGQGKAMRIRGVQHLRMEGNRFEKNDAAVNESKAIEPSGCVNLKLNDE
jgi:hypothetical protein